MMRILPRHCCLSARPFLFLALSLFGTSIETVTPDCTNAVELPEQALEELRLLEEETVVSSVLHEQPISQSPSNLYVTTDEDIRQSGAIDLPSVIRRIPGMSVIQTTGADFNVSARGGNQFGANKTLVMVDGRSIYIDAQGLVFWKAIPVTLSEIKRIEVLKGPASAVYGFNAFDGVIHIITKSPSEMKGTTLQFGGGEFGTIVASGVHAGMMDKFGYRLSIGRDQTNKWRDRNSLAFRSNKFNVQTEYALPREFKFKVSGGLVYVNNNDGPVFEDTFNENHRFKQGYTNVVIERSNFVFRAFWNRFDNDVDNLPNPLLTPFFRVTDPSGNPRSSLNSNTYNILTQYSKEFASAHRVTLGVNYRHNTLTGNVVSDFSRENRLGFYFQDEWKPFKALALVAGLRYDLDSFISPTYSPRVALLYTPVEGHTFRAAVSVAFRPPTLFEENATLRSVTTIPGFPTSTTFVQGSSNLDPEHIVSYQVGYQGWFFKHRLRLRTDIFYNRITDLINFTDINPTTSTALNASGVAKVYGGEASMEFLITPWLTGFANYAFKHLDQTFTGTVRRGGPRFKINGGLRVDLDNGVNGEVGIYHVGAATYPRGQAVTDFANFGLVQAQSERVGSYNLLNLRAGYRFWRNKAEVAFTAFNALNDKHREHPLGDVIRSRVMVWLTLKF